MIYLFCVNRKEKYKSSLYFNKRQIKGTVWH